MTQAPERETETLNLAGDFPTPDSAVWMELVEKSLGGRPYEKLTSTSYDGLKIKPLYTADDGDAEIGIPGAAPFVRGASALGASQTGWDVRCLSAHPDPKEANRQILEDLAKGATSIVLKLDPTGRTGTVLKSRADMEALLDGVYLDLAPVVLDPGGPSLPPAAFLMDLINRRGANGNMDPKAFAGNFGADPLSTLAVVGKVIVPMETLLGRMADLAAHTSASFPKAKALNISTAAYHTAGCSEAQELAIAMATAVEYLRHMAAAGLSVDEGCQQVAFTLTCDTDVFLTIAKLRVARRLWARVAEACGASTNLQAATLHAVTAPRMMSRRDPWVNMLRCTAACFAAGVGGADGVTVLPFESATGLPTALGRRIARNSQIILQEESSIDRVVDPAGGAWMAEQLTAELAEKAWALFQDIERRGGMAAVLVDGSLASQISETEVSRAKRIATRKDALTGVSEYPNIAEKPVTIDTPDLAAIGTRADATAAAASGTVTGMPSHGKGTLMAALVQAASENTSAPTMGAALKGTPMEVTPLPQHRLAEDFEALRDAADARLAASGTRPSIFLANIGKIAEFTARASFATNVFEAGGLETVSGSGGTDVASITDAFTKSDAKAAVICATDDLYAEHAADLAEALVNAGAEAVYLAGRGGAHEDAWRASGVNEFIYMGCDVLAVLKDAHARLGVSS